MRTTCNRIVFQTTSCSCQWQGFLFTLPLEVPFSSDIILIPLWTTKRRESFLELFELCAHEPFKTRSSVNKWWLVMLQNERTHKDAACTQILAWWQGCMYFDPGAVARRSCSKSNSIHLSESPTGIHAPNNLIRCLTQEVFSRKGVIYQAHGKTYIVTSSQASKLR